MDFTSLGKKRCFCLFVWGLMFLCLFPLADRVLGGWDLRLYDEPLFGPDWRIFSTGVGEDSPQSPVQVISDNLHQFSFLFVLFPI